MFANERACIRVRTDAGINQVLVPMMPRSSGSQEHRGEGFAHAQRRHFCRLLQNLATGKHVLDVAKELGLLASCGGSLAAGWERKLP